MPMREELYSVDNRSSSRSDARRLVLASQSPRRRELLSGMGINFDVIVPSSSAEPEGSQPLQGELTCQFVERLALQKSLDVAERVTFPALVIGCDTVAEVESLILGKPVDLRDARRILNLLNGRRHSVWSGLAIVDSVTLRTWTANAESQLELNFPDEAALEQYLESGQWQGKSGAFGYQDDHAWLTLISGSKENVVGLPIDLLEKMLADIP